MADMYLQRRPAAQRLALAPLGSGSSIRAAGRAWRCHREASPAALEPCVVSNAEPINSALSPGRRELSPPAPHQHAPG